MWEGAAFHHLRNETKGRRSTKAHGPKSSKGPLMAPSRRGQTTFKVGRWVVLGIVILVFILCRAWEIHVEEDLSLVIAERILLAMEGSRDGRNRGRNIGGRGVGGLGVDSVAMQLNGVGGEDPWEKWFVLENFPVEVRALTRLEGELGSSIMFEHEGGQSSSTLWLAYILLWHLFHERLDLGRAVEVFTKHYRREAMRSMVKL